MTTADRLNAGDAVVIVGAGLAGLYAALHLAPRRAIVIAPHGPSSGRAGASAWAQGGIAAALGPDDQPADHAADTVAAGAGLTDPRIARLLAEEGPAHVRRLAALGVPFDREAGGAFALSREAAHGRARVARVGGDGAGRAIMRAVGQAVTAVPHVTLLFGLAAVDLLRDAHGRVAGVLARDENGRLTRIAARDVVLATGGVGGLYAVTTNPPTAEGDALAMAARAGAVIADPEFVQFHPTAIDVGRDPAPLATEALRGEGALLVDRDGAPLCDPLAPRDTVARAVHRARLAGRGAFLDARDAVGAEFPERFAGVFAACQAAGIDPRVAPVPVAPAAHYHMGGVATDDRGRASVPNLWAAGEAASTGAHGANRLASNSLLEAVVFAARAADALRDGPGAAGAADAAEAPPPLADDDRAAVRALMAEHVGVERTGDGLAAALDRLDAFGAPGAAPNAVLAARLIAAGALARKESRGAHARADFPSAAEPVRHTRLVLEGGKVRAAEIDAAVSA